MKKKILMIFVFAIMFFIGNIDVQAEKAIKECKLGKKGCENYAKAQETVLKALNKKYKNARIACFYEVKTTEGTYFNFIFYDENSSNLYSSSTVGGRKITQKLSSNGNSWLLGSAYDAVMQNNQCPRYSYIDFNAYNETCYDNDGECLKLKNNNTSFKKTNTSIVRDKNSSALKYKTVNWPNSCDKDALPTEYSTDNSKVCKYKANVNGSTEYVLLLSNSKEFTLLYNKANGTRVTIEGNGTTIADISSEYWQSRDSKDYYTYGEYKNNVNTNITNCPTSIYLNLNSEKAGVDWDWSGLLSFDYQNQNALDITYTFKYSFDSEANVGGKNYFYFKYVDCSDMTMIPETKYSSCYSYLTSADLTEDLNNIVTILRIAIPILLIVLLSYDIAMAVFSGDDKIKKIKGRIIKRIIIAIIIFFVPTLLELTFKLFNEIWGKEYDTCGISETMIE